MKNILVWIATLGMFATSLGQEKQYIILEGTIGKYPIVMNLHQEEMQMDFDDPEIMVWAGDYYYKSQEKPIAIWESDRTESELIIATWEFEHEEDIETFQGKFENGQYKGTWQKGSQRLPFELKETKSKDYTDIVRYQAERIVHPGIKNTNFPIEGKFSFDFYLPKDAKLQKELVEQIFSTYTNFDQFSKFQLDSLESDYKEILKEYENEDEMVHFLNFETIHLFAPYLNTKNYLVMNYFGYEYTGGAHGMSWEKYLTYDKQRKQWLEIQDILEVSKAKEINQVLDKALRKEFNIPNGQLYTEAEAGIFLVDEISYSENFKLSKNGITFCYGLYEMTPYAYGFFELFVLYEDLKPYLKKGFSY